MVCSCANICNFYQTSASYWPWIRYLLLCKTSPVEIVTTLYILYQSHVIITYMPADISKSIQRNFKNLLLLNYFNFNLVQHKDYFKNDGKKEEKKQQEHSIAEGK